MFSHELSALQRSARFASECLGSRFAIVLLACGFAGFPAVPSQAFEEEASPAHIAQSPPANASESSNLESLDPDPSGENSFCMLRDSEGNVQDLSRLCRSGRANAVFRRPFKLPELQPAQPFSPAEGTAAGGRPSFAGSLPDYGVIFLSSVSEDPIHLGFRSNYLSASVGNASSEALDNVRVYYDILLASGDQYSPIGQGSRVIRFAAMQPGERQFFSILPIHVLDQVPPAYRSSRDIAIQVKAIGWTKPDGSTSSFDAKSYQLSRGGGQCYFPWEKDGRGLTCGSRAISERL